MSWMSLQTGIWAATAAMETGSLIYGSPPAVNRYGEYTWGNG